MEILEEEWERKGCDARGMDEISVICSSFLFLEGNSEEARNKEKKLIEG